jgi:hypothetical protein
VICLRKVFAFMLLPLIVLLAAGRLEAAGPTQISFWHYVETASSIKELKALTAEHQDDCGPACQRHARNGDG